MQAPYRGTGLAPLALALALMLAPAIAAASAGDDPRPGDGMRRLNLESFDVVWTTVRDRHFDPDLGGVDWEAVREEFRPRIEAAETRSEARSVLGEMLGRLRQTHFYLIPAESYADLPENGTGSRGGVTGIELRVIDGRAVVRRVVEGSPAAEAGVRPGWVLVGIDGHEVAAILEPIAAEFAGATRLPAELGDALAMRLSGKVGDAVDLEFLDGDDRRVEREIALAEPAGRRIDRGELAPPFHLRTDMRRIEGDLGYIAFNGFVDTVGLMTEFNEAMESFLDADGIVLDLRGNPGGLGAMSVWMAGWFVGDPGKSLGTIVERDHRLEYAILPRARTYDGPVAILVDGHSASTAELLARGLQDLGRACVFGSRTAGASQPADIVKLPNGDRFVHAVAKHLAADGEPVEGVGVKPDIEAAPTREDLLAERDPALEAAVRWIRGGAPLLDRESRRLNVEAFDAVWTKIRDRHYDPDLGGVDWDAVRDELRPRVVRAISMRQARLLMREMIDRLGLSHHSVIPRELFAKMRGEGEAEGEGGTAFEGETGIDARVIDGHAYVRSVQEGSPAAEAGIRPGWEIVRVGDDEVVPELEEISRHFEGNSMRECILSTALLERFRGRVGSEIRLAFLDLEDLPQERTLVRAPGKGRRFQVGFFPAVHVWIETKQIGEDVGFIAFSAFLDPAHVMPEFHRAMESFLDAKGVVLDLRGNPGGIGVMGTGMAGWFLEEKGRSLGSLLMRDQRVEFAVLPRAETYGGKLALLVDELSASAAECLAGGLQDLGRGRVFGKRTAGAVLNSEIEVLPNGDALQFATADFVSPAGTRLEGRGVIPDVEVATKREDFVAGRDPVLEAALEWIREPDVSDRNGGSAPVNHREARER